MQTSPSTKKTKYISLSESLVSLIKKGQYPRGSKLPSEVELAEQYKVSRQTVLNSLNYLKRDGIIYRVHGSGTYVSDQAPMIGEITLIFIGKPTGLTNSTYDIEILRTMEETFAHQNCTLKVVGLSNQMDESERLKRLETIQGKSMQGVVLLSHLHAEQVAAYFNENMIPMVSLPQRFEGVRIDNVVSDDEEGSVGAVEHLVALGHRRIAFMTFKPERQGQAGKARQMGYVRGLKAFGIPFDRSLVIDQEGEDVRMDITKSLMSSPNPPTAILAMNDIIATFLITRLAQDFGKTVPQDMSIVGFENLAHTPLFNPPLTTVTVPRRAMAVKACEMLLERIENPDMETRTVSFKTELVKRASCAPGPAWPGWEQGERG